MEDLHTRAVCNASGRSLGRGWATGLRGRWQVVPVCGNGREPSAALVGLALGLPELTVGEPVVGLPVVGLPVVGLALGLPGVTVGEPVEGAAVGPGVAQG